MNMLSCLRVEMTADASLIAARDRALNLFGSLALPDVVA